MRWLPLAIAAVLVAGCNANPDSPTDSGPMGNTTSQGTTTPPPSTGNSTTSATTTTSATSTSTYPSGPRFAGHHEEQSASDQDFPGLSANGLLSGGGERVTMEASALNFGGRTYRVSNVCVEPWTEDMAGPSGPAQIRQPAATCTAFGLRDFAPGESIAYNGGWDGTLWSNGGYTPAPSGHYMWALTFTVYTGGSGSQYTDTAQLRLPFTVTVA